MITIFLIGALGYMLGKVNFAGFKLGTSAVLPVALIFGHYGFEVSPNIREMGLILFVTAVGFIAGPVFFENFKKRALSYIILGILITLTGVFTCVAIIKIFDIPTPLAVGILTGALTSTPGLAAAMEASQSPLAAVGYGIAYPFGVIGVVLFVQLIPKLLKYNFDGNNLSVGTSGDTDTKALKKIISFDSFGLFPFCATVTIGLILAKITIPLPGGANFNLGTSGAPLLVGLLAGHFKNLGRVSLNVPKTTLNVLREFGLVLFLMGAGTQAGTGFLEILSQYGIRLFLLGALITVLPLLVGLFMSMKVFKLGMLNALGSICGGMTSTPALGTLISVTKTDNVAAAYAATYPIALVFVILSSQFISILF